jgi:hypothetical protein
MSFRKSSAVMMLFFFMLSCGKDGGSQSQNSMDSFRNMQEVDSDPDSPAPTLAQTFSVKPRMLNFSLTQKEKVLRAAELIEKVVASDEFRKAILTHTYNGKKRFVDSRGLTNAQIYQKILEASESMLKKGRNNVMDLELQLYREETTTIGYTYPNVVRVYMNTKYFENFDPPQVADNMFHEWLHKIGFDHAHKYTPSREHSVPYAIGYLVKKLAKQYQ